MGFGNVLKNSAENGENSARLLEDNLGNIFFKSFRGQTCMDIDFS